MLFLLSFGDIRYRKSMDLLIKSSQKFGVDKVITFNQYDLFTFKDFVIKNRYILRQKRGYGYWLWKPFLIDKILNCDEFKNDENNILFYCDASVEILKPLNILLEKMKNNKEDVASNMRYSDILAFHINHINLNYVKRIIYNKMQIDESDFEKYQQAPQCCGGYMFFKNNDFCRMFAKEWLELCEMPFLIDDCPTPEFSEFSEFIDNRHDQAVFSMLVKKYDIKTYRDPSQFGNKYDDRDFEQIFRLHRKRLHPWFKKERFPFYYQWKELNSYEKITNGK